MNFLIIFIIVIIFIKSDKIIPVPYIDQTADYPTGCESISTVMCLKYHQIDITPNDFIDNYLEKGIFYYKNGQLFAPNPNDKFVGSPYDENSYGCYEGVIEKALKKLVSEKNLNFDVKNLTNVPMNEIISNYIDKDIPVIFWATIDMKQFFNGSIWIVPETGEKFQWRAREHCLLLVGYDNEKDGYYFNDPWDNHGTILYNKALVETRHKEQYSMAVALVKKTNRVNNNE